MYRRKALILCSVIVLAAVLLTPMESFSSPETVTIGVVTARTGALSYYGDMSINGFILGLMYGLEIQSFETITPNMEWKLDWGGREIHIIAADTVPAGQVVPDPATATSAAEDLILNKNVDILLGSSMSPIAIALTQVAERYKVVFLVTPAADHEITKTYLNRYVFQISSNTWHDALTGGKWAVENVGKTFGFIAPANSWGRSTVETWRKAIEEGGGTVVYEAYAPVTATDFTPYIQGLLASGAEVFIPVWAGAGAITLYQQIYNAGVYEKLNVTSGIPDLSTLNLAGMAAYLPNYTGMMKYCWNLPQNNLVNDWLVEKYVELYKQNALPTIGTTLLAFPLPDLFVGNGFVAGHALAMALKETDGSTDSEKLISALEGLEFDTVKGHVKIRKEDHRTIQDMYIAQLVFDNESLPRYYTVDELPDLYKPFYTAGIVAPKHIQTIESVEPPIEAQVPTPTPAPTTPAPTTPLPTTPAPAPAIPGWVYGVIVVLFVLLILVTALYMRKGKKEEE